MTQCAAIGFIPPQQSQSSEMAQPDLLQQRNQLVPCADAMLFGELTRFRRATFPDGINNGPMFRHRSFRPWAYPQRDHACPMRLIHDGVVHANETLVAAVLDEQLVEQFISLRPSREIVQLR